MSRQKRKQTAKRDGSAVNSADSREIGETGAKPPPAVTPPPPRPASRTMQRAGRAVAVYIHDGQGRRLVVATPRAYGDGSMLIDTVVLALTQGEARDAIATLRQLAEELPPQALAEGEIDKEGTVQP